VERIRRRVGDRPLEATALVAVAGNAAHAEPIELANPVAQHPVRHRIHDLVIDPFQERSVAAEARHVDVAATTTLGLHRRNEAAEPLDEPFRAQGP
jgi:hypothetical protein